LLKESSLDRIFSGLAVFSLALLLVTLISGWWVGDYAAAARRLSDAPAEERIATLQEVQPVLERQMWHFLLGVLTVLVAVLVSSISVTYFIGTSRWCREVVETYQLDPQLIARANALKRTAFPSSLIGILTALGIAALGGASDPATGIANAQQWVTPHYFAALIGTAVIAVCFLTQRSSLQGNQRLVGEILTEVRRVRAERGLAVE
jgi:hypothetical protein